MELKVLDDDALSSETTDVLPSLAVVVSIATLLTLLLVLLLCACKNKDKEAEPELYHVNPVPDLKADKTPSNVAVELETVTTEVVGNGSVQSGTETSNGRPMSHERALPDLPPLSSGVPPNEDDEEEDSEGHYDIIPKRAKNAAKVVAKATVGGHHAYEKVTGDPDSDSTYAGIGSDCSGVASCTGGADKQPLYAGVDSDDGSCAAGREGAEEPTEGEVEAMYALIDDNKRKSKVVNTLPASINPSIDTSEGSYASTPPPVPTKNFEAPDEGLSVPPGGEPPSSSPLLPPRNSLNGGTLGEAYIGGAAVNGTSISPVDNTGASGPDNGAGARKKDPPYSHVTARESLENLRKRHSEEMKAAMLAQDAMYASVDYDEIKSPGAAEMPPGGSRVSDLYAEISTGEASCRSSTYAHVGDVGQMLKVAPTPPSVEALKSLSHPMEEEEAPDPGYSRIKSRQRGQRPYSTSSGILSAAPLALPTTSATTAAASTTEQSGRRSPVYAVVDKKRANKRQTVHVDGNVAQTLAIAPDNELEVKAMYAHVNKGPVRVFNNMRPSGPGSSKAQGQGQTKVTIRGHSSIGDPNYQTIDISGGGDDTESLEEDDPDYDTVRGSMLMRSAGQFDPNDDLDPNYETMPAMMTSSSSASASAWQGQAGVATEITGATKNGTANRGNLQLPIREHIYQDIDEAKREAAEQKTL